MKTLKQTIHLGILVVLMGASGGFFSCTSDDQTIIVPKTLAEYKAQMSTFVTAEKLVVDSCIIGYNKGNFKVASTSTFNTVKSNYLTVLNAAQAVLNDSSVTIEKIILANKTLAVPGKAFVTSLFISDRRRLNDSIVVADALRNATLVGNAVNEVPDSSKTTFSAAITKAIATRDGSTYIQRQVDAAVVELSLAKQTFLKAIIK
ncbi:MAG TPA: hypothetical protein VFP20_10730 [Bacteroidales bacterium]|nr:hypothetical protein [Bacteroidales bacterium]